MRFFNDMKFWQKLALIVTALTVPTVYMLVLLKQAKDSAIDFSAAESLGVAHNAPLLDVLPAVAHLDLALALDTRVAADVERWRAELAAALPVAAREVAATTATLDSKSGWDPIAARLGNAAAGAADMEQAGAGLVDLVLHVGDTSNLILDPDIDSFYVMDAIINRVPELVRNLGRYAGLAGRGVEAGRFDAARYSEIMVLQSRIAATLDDMKRNLAKAMAKNDTLEPALGASLHGFDAATAALIARVTALKPDVALDRGALGPIVHDAHAAIDAGATFYRAASPALDRLLGIRIGGLEQDERTAFVAVAICLAVAFAVAFTIIRTTSRAVGRAVAIAGAIAGGNLDNDVVVESSDEIGALLAALAAMQDKLRALLASGAAQLHEMNRIREALDFASASVVLAGADGRIVYLNRTAVRLFESAAGELRRVLGDFDPQALVGSAIDRLRGDAALPAFGTAETAAEGEARFGDRVLHFAVSPVRDAAGTRLGTVLEVTDLTEQKTAEAQIESMILGAANGELDRRLALEKFEPGFQRRLAEGINRMLDALIAPLETAAACIERIACGDIPAPVATEYAGRFRQLRDNINHCIAAIMRLVEDTERLSVAGVAGQLATRADVARHEGDFRRIVEGINNTLDAIVGPIAETQAVIGGLANGDLTHRMRGAWQGDFAQLREAVNGSIDQLRGTIERVRGGAANIQTAASEIATGNLDLNRRTEQQGANLEETAASMEELTSTVKQNAENSREADRVAAEARVHAEQGGAVVGRAVAAMAEIASSSKKIGEIISVIDGLAFQTNLLALNAAVEAARAGEQGRGFAVVASEVRNLAQRSSSAAKEIRQLIQDSVNRVDEGSRLVNESGATLSGIVEAVNRVCGLISGIAAASEEQSSGIGLVNSAVAQMEEGTQQNVALVEETAAASKALDDQTRELITLLAYFRTANDAVARPAAEALAARAPQRRAG